MAEKLVDLLRHSFEIFVKKRWLKEIDRAIDDYQKIQRKANRKYYVMNVLIKRYNELYNDNLWVKKTQKENEDRCVCCGAIIPEGQMVRPNCLVAVKEG